VSTPYPQELTPWARSINPDDSIAFCSRRVLRFPNFTVRNGANTSEGFLDGEYGRR
jgi:hypothetical protein